LTLDLGDHFLKVKLCDKKFIERPQANARQAFALCFGLTKKIEATGIYNKPLFDLFFCGFHLCDESHERTTRGLAKNWLTVRSIDFCFAI